MTTDHSWYPLVMLWPAEDTGLWLARVARRLRDHIPPIPVLRQRSADDAEPSLIWMYRPWADLITVVLRPIGPAVHLTVWSAAWDTDPAVDAAQRMALAQRVLDDLLDQMCLPTDPLVRYHSGLTGDAAGPDA